MTEEQKAYIAEMIDEVARRKDISLSIYWIPGQAVSISVYPYSEEE